MYIGNALCSCLPPSISVLYSSLLLLQCPPSFFLVISSDLLNTPITDHNIATIARDYLVNWEELAPHLELTAPQEQSIRKDFREYELQKREALRMWKRNKGNGATYHTFITVAENISNMQLADNVRALLEKQLQHNSKGL